MLDAEQKEFLKDLINDIYKSELIFQDFKKAELDVNYNDTKFIIPQLNLLNDNKDLLKTICNDDIIYNRLEHMIVKESIRTLDDNTNNIDKVVKYSYKNIKG